MRRIIEISIEIDIDEKMLYMGEDYSSGVKEQYNNINEISEHIKNYLEEYHKEDIENTINKNTDEIELIE